MMTSQDTLTLEYEALTQGLQSIALAAGTAIMTIYGREFHVETKDDKSPVTEADQKAEDIILPRLKALAPNIPVISEEAASEGHIPDIGSHFFLVDPLDGTKEFINRNGEFTVNIALIEHGIPRAGVVYAPALGRMFFSAGPGQAREIKIEPSADDAALSATRPGTPLHIRHPNMDEGLIVVGSRSHRSPETEEYLKDVHVKDFVAAGSSLKFCLVAAGEADLYPRHGRTMEWDTAAGHAVLIGAGGCVTNLDDSPFLYGKTNDGYANPFFIAKGNIA